MENRQSSSGFKLNICSQHAVGLGFVYFLQKKYGIALTWRAFSTLGAGKK
jgi:hypothetical protein